MRRPRLLAIAVLAASALLVEWLVRPDFDRSADFRFEALANPTRTATAVVTRICRTRDGQDTATCRFDFHGKTIESTPVMASDDLQCLRVGSRIQVNYLMDNPPVTAYRVTWFHGPYLLRSWLQLYPMAAGIAIAVLWLTRRAAPIR
ncbi:MAG TPA: hypothetical protein VMI31_15720 [Fimbriimonadaceae bacterium]|nr:hypothetical protein [Fimbriimonadaceae bacterium]